LNEFALAAPIYFGRQTTEHGPRVLEAHFVNARPRTLDALQAFFQTAALSFGAEANALVFDSASLEQPQRTADARLLATAQSFGHRELQSSGPVRAGTRAMVAERLRSELGVEAGRIRKVARELQMSVRTLQRRLSDESTSFAEVLDEVREQVARELMRRTDIPLAEIAHRLDFADFATFSRAFKRWTGVSPGAFRSDTSEPG
jgi:AraC-like DNA-binding protein